MTLTPTQHAVVRALLRILRERIGSTNWDVTLARMVSLACEEVPGVTAEEVDLVMYQLTLTPAEWKAEIIGAENPDA